MPPRPATTTAKRGRRPAAHRPPPNTADAARRRARTGSREPWRPASPQYRGAQPDRLANILAVNGVASVRAMNDSDAIAALVNDLHWQIDQLGPRGIKDKAGNPYNPAYYKRGLNNAIDRGELAVADYVRRYVYKAPSDGYRKLAEADSLDLACEALVADDSRPYAHLFTEEDRAAARKRL